MACNRCEKHKRKWTEYQKEIEKVHKRETEFLKEKDKIDSLLEKIDYKTNLSGNELKKDLVTIIEEIKEMIGDFK